MKLKSRQSAPSLDQLADTAAATANRASELEKASSERKAAKIAAFALRQVAKGRTDMPAKKNGIPSFLGVAEASPAVAKSLIARLGEHGLRADVYGNYLGGGDSEDRIAITKIGDTRVKPSPAYARELEMRAIRATHEAKSRRVASRGHTAESQPVLHEQTGKYVRRIGEREYVSTDEPHGVVNFKRFADDAAYAEALSTKVIQCVDIVVHDPKRDTILIGTRQQEPHAGDWVIGGGMRAGESVVDSAHRNMRRELGVDIDDDLVSKVGDYKFVWDSRVQGPTLDEDNQAVVGCHTSSTLVHYPMSEEAVDLTSFNEEYSDVQWVPASQIITAPVGDYHPCLVDMVTDMKAQGL